jgi:pilus assembly protein CpaC
MKSILIWCLVCAACCLSSGVIYAGDLVQELTMYEGRSLSVDIPGGIRRIHVMNEDILNAKPLDDGKTLLMIARAAGMGQVRVEQMGGLSDAVYNVKVLKETTELVHQLRELLSHIEGIEIYPVDNKAVIKGTLVIPSDYEDVKRIANSLSDEKILNLAKYDASRYSDLLAETIQKEIGINTVKVSVYSGDRARLEGYVFNEEQKHHAVRIASARVPNVDDLLRLEDATIEADVYFLKLRASKTENIGFNVLETLNLDVNAEGSAALTSFSSDDMQLNVAAGFQARIRALQGSGDAEILAKPHVSVKSGNEARLMYGGEIGFAIAGDTGGSLEKVEYGMILTVLPTFSSGEDKVNMEVELEVSVPTEASQGGYQLEKFLTRSQIECPVGQSVIVSGLAQQMKNYFREKTPLLGDIPLLSLFFSNKAKRNTQDDLVMVITPQVVLPQIQSGAVYSEQQKHLIER